MASPRAKSATREVDRVQTGVRLERRVLGVLKALADLHGMSLGDLLEGIVLHAFEGKAPFEPATLKKIRQLKQAFELDLTAADAHRLGERAS
jgi:hypothetical protein